MVVDGTTDPLTGYLVSVADVDAAVRETLLPALRAGIGRRPTPPLPMLLANGAERLAVRLPVNVRSISLCLGRYFRITMETDDMSHCLLRQSFEFSAAHRLHCPSLDAARNREMFGKCNNPNGHGHNYRLEVAVRVPLDPSGAMRPGLAEIESVVRTSVIDRLDHTHLNEDVPHFREVNPSVENIAEHCRSILDPEVARVGGQLAWLTLWETEKTACTVGAAGLGSVGAGPWT